MELFIMVFAGAFLNINLTVRKEGTFREAFIVLNLQINCETFSLKINENDIS